MSHRVILLAVLAALVTPVMSVPAEAGMVFVPHAQRPPGWRGSPYPVARPTPTPTPVAADPTPELPFRVETSTWIIPETAGTGVFDFSFARPTWLLNASYWRGRWGLGLEAIAFNTTYAPFRTAPYFQATTPMVEGQLRHQWPQFPLETHLGLRTLGQADLVFGMAGATWRQPLGLPGLAVSLDGRGGHNLQNSFVVDASVQLGYRVRGAEFVLGFRQLALQVSGDPLFLLNGPTAGLAIRF